MQKTHIGIQADTFQGGSTVVGQKAVRKGQHGIESVQRRSAAALTEKEGILSLQDHVVKNSEIGSGAGALQPPETVQRGFCRDLRQKPLQLLGHRCKAAAVNSHGMIPSGAIHTPAGVIDLAQNHHSGHAAAFRGIVGDPILRPPQQHIALHLSGDTGKELPSLGTKRQPDFPLGASTHQCR